MMEKITEPTLINDDKNKETEDRNKAVENILAKPETIKHYGRDTIAVFVNILKDATSDPQAQSERIRDTSQTLISLREDLIEAQKRVEQYPRGSYKKQYLEDIKEALSPLNTLITVSKQVSLVESANKITDAVNNITGIVNESNETVKISYSDNHDNVKTNLETGIYNKKSANNKKIILITLITSVIACTITSFIIFGISLNTIGMVLLTGLIAEFIYNKVDKENFIPNTKIDGEKISTLAKYNLEIEPISVWNYLTNNETETKFTYVKNEELTNWIKKSAKVFDILSNSDIKNANTRRPKTNVDKAVTKLAQEFSDIIYNTEKAKDEELTEYQKGIEKVNKQIEQTNSLRNIAQKRQITFEEYLNS